jgi:hypothetical protein
LHHWVKFNLEYWSKNVWVATQMSSSTCPGHWQHFTSLNTLQQLTNQVVVSHSGLQVYYVKVHQSFKVGRFWVKYANFSGFCATYTCQVTSLQCRLCTVTRPNFKLKSVQQSFTNQGVGSNSKSGHCFTLSTCVKVP